MADANIKINIETQSLDQLNVKLATLQTEIKKVPVGSAEFKRLSAEIRKLDGAVEGANKKLKALDVGQLAGNFAKVGASVASASALFKQFGDQGSDSNKQIQNALEATNTILGAAAIAEGVAAAGEVAFAVATEGATVAQEFFAAAVGTSTGALAALKVALITTGIGALIVGLGLLISAFMDSADAAETSKAAIEDLGKEYERLQSYLNKQSEYNKLAEAEELKRAQLQKKSAKEVADIKEKFLIKERNLTLSLQAANTKRLNEELALEFKTQGERRKADDAYAKYKAKGIQSLTEQERGYYLRISKIQDEYSKRNDALQVKRAQLDAEITQTSLDAQLEAQKKSEEAAQKAADAAQQRRDKLKADLDQITNILKEQSVAFSLQTIQADYERINKILDGLKNQSKDYKGVLKELTAEGFGPLAKVLEKTFGKDAKANLDQIREAIKKSFSEETLSNVTASLENISSKLKDVTEQSNKSLEEIIKIYSDTAKAPFNLITNSIDVVDGKIETSTTSIKVSLQDAFTKINSFTKDSAEKLKANAAEQIKTIQDLVSKGLLTPEQAKQFFDKINEEYNKGIKSIQEKGLSSSQSLINSFISANQKTVQDNLTRLGKQLTEAETKLINDSLGKGTFKRLKLEKDFQKEKFGITKAGLLSEFLQNENAQFQLEGLKEKGLITEEQYTAEKEKLSKQETQVVLKNEKTLADERNRRLQESLTLAEAYLQEVKKYYDVIAQGIQAIGNIIADQATLNDIRLQEEIETVNLLYDQRFALIDAEEKKLDDLAAAKEKNLTAEERKRRQLSTQRAELEAQQQQELAQLENERANAAADAAIKQANVNFALAVGQIAIATAEAITKSVAASPVTFGLPFSAFAAAAGALQLGAAESARSAAIATAEASRPRSVSLGSGGRISKAEGGLITGPGNGVSDSIPANLSNGEFVVNANATQKFLPLLSALNSSGLQGGNPVNPSGGNNEMVALLQEIKSQLAQPNRSYVVASDLENIQNKQNYINRRSNVL